MWIKISKALVTRYVLLILPLFFAFVLLILVFGMSAIIHQKLVAMPLGLMRFAYRLKSGCMAFLDFSINR